MRYYSILRPVGPGTIPPSNVYSPTKIHNFDNRQFCEDIGCKAWGYVEYLGCIPEEDAARYGLVSAEQKLWYCVTTAIYDNGRVTAAITSTKSAAIQPDSSETHTSRRDIYTDWYDSKDAADAAVKEAREA